MAPMFTTRNFERSHGRPPRGRGSWAFQESATDAAFEEDMRGDVEWFHGTYSEAREQAAQAFAGAEFVAVMP